MSKQWAVLTKLFSLHPPPIPPDEVLLRLWNKNFLKETYRNIQIFAFKVLEECSSWMSRNGPLQFFFLTPNRNMFAGKFVKWERFFILFWKHIIFSIKGVEVNEISELNRIEKWVIFFASFCWLWDFLLGNLKSRKNSDVHWNVRKNVVCRKKYFQNKNSCYELLNHL